MVNRTHKMSIPGRFWGSPFANRIGGALRHHGISPGSHRNPVRQPAVPLGFEGLEWGNSPRLRSSRRSWSRELDGAAFAGSQRRNDGNPGRKGGVSLVVLLFDQSSGRLSPRRAGLWTHMRALLTAGRLDRTLALGVPPEVSVELALRSESLVRPSHRRKVASSLRLLLAAVDRSHPAPRFAVPLCREQIEEAAADMRALIDGLVASGPVAAQGVARVRLLLGDGCGPLYNRASGDSVRQRVKEAILALDPLSDM